MDRRRATLTGHIYQRKNSPTSRGKLLVGLHDERQERKPLLQPNITGPKTILSSASLDKPYLLSLGSTQSPAPEFKAASICSIAASRPLKDQNHLG